MTQFTCRHPGRLPGEGTGYCTDWPFPHVLAGLHSLDRLSFPLEKDWVQDLLERENKEIIFHYF